MRGAVRRLTAILILFSFASTIVRASEIDLKSMYQVMRPDHSFFSIYTFPNVPAYLAVNSAAEWVAYWSVPGRLSLRVANGGQPRDEAPHVPDPPVDFDRYTLLMITDGPKPTPGYSTSIASIWESGSILRITVINVSPIFDSTCAVAQVQTNPTVIALIAKTIKHVVFDVEEATTKFCNRHRSIEGGA